MTTDDRALIAELIAEKQILKAKIKKARIRESELDAIIDEAKLEREGQRALRASLLLQNKNISYAKIAAKFELSISTVFAVSQ